MGERNASADGAALQKLPPAARGVSPSQRRGDVLRGKHLGQKKSWRVGAWGVGDAELQHL